MSQSKINSFVFVPFVFCVIAVGIVAISSHIPVEADEQPASSKVGGKEIVRLFELRTEVAKLRVKSDEAKVAYLKDIYEDLRDLFKVNAVSESQYEEAAYNYQQAVVDLELSKVQLKGAEVQLNLAKMGTDRGSLSVDDIHLPPDILEISH